MVVGHLTWVLEIKLGSSRRGDFTFNCQAISTAQEGFVCRSANRREICAVFSALLQNVSKTSLCILNKGNLLTGKNIQNLEVTKN